MGHVSRIFIFFLFFAKHLREKSQYDNNITQPTKFLQHQKTLHHRLTNRRNINAVVISQIFGKKIKIATSTAEAESHVIR